jgi:4-hydroxy-3-polyprenylbenzoate decarboxylase
LLRIQTFVDPHLEIAEITDRMSKQPGGGKALLFENTGYNFPVLMNAYGSEKRICLALGVNQLDEIAQEIEGLFKLIASPKESIIDKLKLLPRLSEFASWMPKVKKGEVLVRKWSCPHLILPNSRLLPAGQRMEDPLLRFPLFTQKTPSPIPETLVCIVCRYLALHLPVCTGTSIK